MDKITAFIDTSVFIKENFTASRSFQQLLELAAKNEINLIITDIVYGEVLSNQAKQLEEALPIMKKTYNIRNKEGRVLRCYEDLEALFVYPDLDKGKLIAQFRKAFDEKIEKAHIDIISSKDTKVDYIFDRYFTKVPPFSEKKKDEFPDAFSLKTIIEHVKSRRIKNFCIVAGDSDLLIKEVRKFSCFKEVSELINEHISRKKKHTETLALIARIYKEKIEELCYFKDEIFSLFEAYVYSGKYNPDSFKEIESIDDIKIPKVKFAKDYNVIEINDRSAIIETTVEIYYQIEFTYNDYEGAYYEKEEDEWYFLEQETDVVDEYKTFPVTIEIDYAPPAGSEFGDAEIIDIDLSIL